MDIIVGDEFTYFIAQKYVVQNESSICLLSCEKETVNLKTGYTRGALNLTRPLHNSQIQLYIFLWIPNVYDGGIRKEESLKWEREGHVHGPCDLKALSCHRRDEVAAKDCRCRPFSG